MGSEDEASMVGVGGEQLNTVAHVDAAETDEETESNEDEELDDVNLYRLPMELFRIPPGCCCRGVATPNL